MSVLESDYLYIMQIKHDTIVDGVGMRSTVYCSLCQHHCRGCHNPQSWKIENGEKKSVQDVYQELVSNEETNVTFSGGDPMFQAKGFLELAKLIKENTNKTIWCYTGFTWEEILADKKNDKYKLLELCDILVDGKYIETERSLSLKFRGSQNQRIILIQESLKQNQIIPYKE